jgi:hypothetical protein
MNSNRVNLTRRHNAKYAVVIGLLLSIGALPACQMQQQIISAHEDNLAAAGFIIRPANTPNGKRC